MGKINKFGSKMHRQWNHQLATAIMRAGLGRERAAKSLNKIYDRPEYAGIASHSSTNQKYWKNLSRGFNNFYNDKPNVWL